MKCGICRCKDRESEAVALVQIRAAYNILVAAGIDASANDRSYIPVCKEHCPACEHEDDMVSLSYKRHAQMLCDFIRRYFTGRAGELPGLRNEPGYPIELLSDERLRELIEIVSGIQLSLSNLDGFISSFDPSE